jgi:O-antigen ligase
VPKLNIVFEGLCFFLVGISVLVVIPGMYSGVEVGKVFWIFSVVEFWLWCRLVMVGWMSLGKSEARWWFYLWLLFSALSGVISGGDWFWGGFWRRQGWWFMAHMGVLYYLVATSGLAEKVIERMFGLVCLVVMLWGVIEWVARGQIGGRIGEWNTWGLLSVFLFFLAWTTLPKQRNLSALALLGVVVSTSRSAILALAVVGWGKVNWFVRVAGGAVLAVLLVVFTLGRGWGDRNIVWIKSLSLVVASPVWGIGFENFQSKFAELMKNRGLEWTLFDHPHNMFLWLLVSTGVVGAVLVGIWLYQVFKHYRGGVWKDLAVASLVFGLFQPWLTVVWVYFMVFVGMMERGRQTGASMVGLKFDRWWLAKLVWATLAVGMCWWLGVWSLFKGYF